ncbi:uncharacterized protein LOC116248920 [Nymphaea colorata]|nr:uncharacterized protein LOC116248920 [Nymphaea colorata]
MVGGVMDNQKEKAAWMSVPQFGDWDVRCGVPDYSMDFSKIRESRKQIKKDLWRSSVGNEEELIISHPRPHDHDYHHLQQHKEQQHEQVIRFQTRREKILSYFSSCIKAFPSCKCGRVL